MNDTTDDNTMEESTEDNVQGISQGNVGSMIAYNVMNSIKKRKLASSN